MTAYAAFGNGSTYAELGQIDGASLAFWKIVRWRFPQ